MTAAYTRQGSTPGAVLHLAFELGWTHWKLAFTVGLGQKPRLRTMAARDLAALWRYLQRGEVPAGARLVDWRSKLTNHKAKKPAA
jgi:hypothetical protein